MHINFPLLSAVDTDTDRLAIVVVVFGGAAVGDPT